MFNIQKKLFYKNIRPKDVIHRWKIIKGDMVEAIHGKDKGKQGKVIKVIRSKNKIVVDGLNVTKRHIKKGSLPPNSEQKQSFTFAPSPIHYSNLALIDPTDHRPTRVGFKYLEDGTKVRVSRRTGIVIPKPPMEKKRENRTSLGAQDTQVEHVLLKTFDERTLNPLLIASQQYIEWTLPAHEAEAWAQQMAQKSETLTATSAASNGSSPGLQDLPSRSNESL